MIMAHREKSDCYIINILIRLQFSVMTLKDAMSVSFRSELFTSYILTIFKQRNILPKISEAAKYSYSCM